MVRGAKPLLGKGFPSEGWDGEEAVMRMGEDVFDDCPAFRPSRFALGASLRGFFGGVIGGFPLVTGFLPDFLKIA
jgi:hypothetical protein